MLVGDAGAKDRPRLLRFLDQHAAAMPRVVLRYAIEHLDPDQRQHYRSPTRKDTMDLKLEVVPVGRR